MLLLFMVSKTLCRNLFPHGATYLVHIGLEETGIYSSNIYDFLYSFGFNVYMINPILTHHSRMAHSLRNTKTDKLDCLAICRYIKDNLSHLKPYISTLYTTGELKSLSRLRLDKLKTLSKAKMEFTRLLQIIFPEFAKHFDQHSLWAKKLFTHYLVPLKISRMHDDTLVDIIRIQGDRVAAASLIKSLAKNTIGRCSLSNELLIQSCLDDIEHFSNQISIIDEHLEILMKDFEFITTIPGVATITGALIIGEIGDIHRFNSSSQLLAFAGLDPSIYESGDFKSKKCRISKRGSRYLRSAIFTSTQSDTRGSSMIAPILANRSLPVELAVPKRVSKLYSFTAAARICACKSGLDEKSSFALMLTIFEAPYSASLSL